jgi:hypothetical protein
MPKLTPVVVEEVKHAWLIGYHVDVAISGGLCQEQFLLMDYLLKIFNSYEDALARAFFLAAQHTERPGWEPGVACGLV